MNHRRRATPERRYRAIYLALAVLVLLGAAMLLWASHAASEPAPTGARVPLGTAPAGASPLTPVTAPARSPGLAKPSPHAPVVTPGDRPSPSAATVTRTAVPPSSGGSAASGKRTVTFVNAVHQTIWVAAWQQTAKPALPVTGWVLPAGQRLSITVPDKWNGRFWGRTGCAFDASGHGHCDTGDCAGRFQCRQYGGIPATLAEYNLNSWHNLDFYDVSMVDGSNLPMFINITHGVTKDPVSASGCTSAGCTRPVACPSVLRVTASGSVVGCISACAHFGTDQYCCRGQWAPRSECQPSQWPVDYAAVFKKAEPFAYSYVDDDATSTFTCSGECGYRITFGLSPG